MYHKFRELLSVVKQYIIDEGFPLLQLIYSESIERMCNLEKLDYCFSIEEAEYYIKTEDLEYSGNKIKDCLVKFPRDIKFILERCFGTDIDIGYWDILFMYVESLP